MAIRATYGLRDPNNTEATMSITMTIGQWERLSEQLSGAFPGWSITPMINQLVDKARKHFHETGGGEA